MGNSVCYRVIASLLVTFLVSSANGTVLLTEDFSYADGAIVGQGGTVDGWGGSWNGSGLVNSGRLHIPDGTFFGSNNRSVVTLAPPNDGESYYFAFDLTVASTGGSATGSAYPTGSSGSYWVIGQSGAAFDINGPAGPAGTIVAGETYRLVTRGTRNDATPDIADLWIDPVSEADTPLLSFSDNTIVGVSNSLSNFNLNWENNTGGDIFIDNFVMATSFAEVASVPEPVTAFSTLFGLASVALIRRRSF